MHSKEISLIGLGGVGGYFGYKLCKRYAQKEGVSVTFIARDRTYEVVKEKGLRLISPESDTLASYPDKLLKKTGESPLGDILLICVKTYDLEDICRDLKDKIEKNTVIIPLMNGVDIYERIRKVIRKGIVLPACVYVAAHIQSKGVIEHRGKPGEIIVGKDPENRDFPVEKIIQLFRLADINMVFSEDVLTSIWSKYIFIAGFGLVTAAYNVPIGEVVMDMNLKKQAEGIIKEIEKIAHTKGIALAGNIIEKTFEKAKSFPPDSPTSLQLDIHSNRPNNELDLFGGTIIRMGQAMDIPVPATLEIYERLLKME